jgi:hypothetical protein
MAEYVPEVNRWNVLTTGSPSELIGRRSTVAVPISTYGVIMYIVYTGGNGAAVWLYKHKQGQLPPLDLAAPRAPAGIGFK